MILRLFGLFVERKDGVALERRFGENRRVFACSLIAAESSGVKRLEERRVAWGKFKPVFGLAMDLV